MKSMSFVSQNTWCKNFLRNCDKIYVLENQPGSNQGSVVVESGTHDELMKISDGKYLALRNAFDGESPAGNK